MRFELFALTALLSAVFVLLARNEPNGTRSRWIGILMGATLLINFVVYNVYRWRLPSAFFDETHQRRRLDCISGEYSGK